MLGCVMPVFPLFSMKGFTQQRMVYQELSDHHGAYTLAMLICAALTVAGGVVAYYMHHRGHVITGMDNHIVWGLPHVVAVFLIVSASGALNVASISSVFGKNNYAPWARLSVLLAAALLLGGLAIILLDLGRPDRLIVALTHYNFKSVFTWNILLYSGFIAVCLLYLMALLTPNWQTHSSKAGWLAFIWRLLLTTGTGLIFGVLLARNAYFPWLIVPAFIAASLSFGLALFLLVLLWVQRSTARVVPVTVLSRLTRLNAKLALIALVSVLLHHGVNMLVEENRSFARLVLWPNSWISVWFWLGQVLVGTALPCWLFLKSTANARNTTLGAITIVLGGLAMMVVLIIGGQAVPMPVVDGFSIVNSSFQDGTVLSYWPKLAEWLLSVGGVGLVLFLALLGMRVLPILPQRIKPMPNVVKRNADVDAISKS